MKLICLNQDECGYVEQLGTMSEKEIIEFSTKENLICDMCASLALLYTDKHKPIFYGNEQEFDNKVDLLIALMHNFIKINEGEEGDR